MTKALRGINIGGWLIAERWMTPELFHGVDEHGERAIGRALSEKEARARIEQHRKMFITEADFVWIKKAGFDLIRLPVGYWLFEDAEGYVSGEQYVDQAFAWAAKYGLQVVLDFHGLQGSQNGHDHSGEVGKVRLYRRGNRKGALKTMEHLARRYGHEPALAGIEVINEPKVRWFLWRLLRYYDKAYAIAETYAREDVKIIVSDAFKPLRMAKALSKRNYGSRLVLDVHMYQVFSQEDKLMSFEGHIQKTQHEWSELLDELRLYVPDVMVGEWSAALSAEAYEGLEGGEARHVRTYFEAQQKVFDEKSWAHCYWSYTAPAGGVWDYRNGLTER